MRSSVHMMHPAADVRVRALPGPFGRLLADPSPSQEDDSDSGDHDEPRPVETGEAIILGKLLAYNFYKCIPIKKCVYVYVYMYIYTYVICMHVYLWIYL